MAKHAWKGIKFLTLHEVLEQCTFFKQIVSGHGLKVACIFKTFRDHGCLTVAYHFDQINNFLVYFTDFSAFFINIIVRMVKDQSSFYEFRTLATCISI